VNHPPSPGPRDEHRPDTRWYRRRPDADDPTRVALPQPPAFRSTPGPPDGRPWYLQRPDRSPPSAPLVAQEKPALVLKDGAAPDLKKFIPWLLAGAGGLAVLIAAMVLVGNIARLGVTGGTVLDVTKVQSGVLQTLSDPASGYGANTVTDVSCNGGRNPSAHQGTTFICDAIVNGALRHVTVVVSDDRGTYEIDSPR
jgi:Domain of unknown function (DUF4333)